jgi:hypothetical protein
MSHQGAATGLRVILTYFLIFIAVTGGRRSTRYTEDSVESDLSSDPALIDQVIDATDDLSRENTWVNSWMNRVTNSPMTISTKK